MANFHSGRRKSKRLTCRMKYKIIKKVKAHHKKKNKELEKRQKVNSRKITIIPTDCPFRQEVLQEAEEYKKKKADAIAARRAAWLEEKKRLKEKEEEVLAAAPTIESLVKTAEQKKQEYEETIQNALKVEMPIFTKKEGSLRAYYREFKKVVEASDVVIEVVDARDPLGTRCSQVENAVLESQGKKRLVILINKCDLIPGEVLHAWLKYLRGFFPTLPFKASTQTQRNNLGRKKSRKGRLKSFKTKDDIHISPCIGADYLMSLLANYCRNQNIRTAITVGVVGLPNVGKSSVINSMKRSRACCVGAVPGITTVLQAVQLDSRIKLLDSPGLVFAAKTGRETDASVALKNAVKVEALEDPLIPASAILQRATKEAMMEQYDISSYNTLDEFLILKAKRTGKMKKGGVLDRMAAARGLIDDWNRGKIKYYTLPPESKDAQIDSAIVSEMAKEFDIDNIEEIETKTLSDINTERVGRPFLVESTNHLSEAIMAEEDGILGKNVYVSKRVRKRKLVDILNKPEKKTDLVPLSMAQKQKLEFKKRNRDSRRKARVTAALVEGLEDCYLSDDEFNFDHMMMEQ